MSNFIPKEIINYIIGFVEDLKKTEYIRNYFKEHISDTLKVNIIKNRFNSYYTKYDIAREFGYNQDFFQDIYNDYEEKFIQMYYTELEDDFNILIRCKCCIRHQKNRPIHLVNTPLHTYKKRYDRFLKYEENMTDTENMSDTENETCICECPCRFLARSFVRINKTTRILHEEDIRSMLFYEAVKRVNYNRLNDVERYKEHFYEFPDITIEEEKNILFSDFFEKYLIKN